jgi:putative hydrolase of the HAD superfamily
VQAAGATAQTSVMIGDSLEADIQGARLYGMDQIYFNPGRTQHKYNCTYEIDCLSKLKTLL